jgi:DDE superfamily endonuclease
MEDVLEVYARPLDKRRPVVCMDEAGKQLVRATRQALPMKPGTVARHDYEYERNGMANLFVFCQPLTGRCQVRVTERKTRVDWAHAIREMVELDYPRAEKIVLVMDNLNTHSASSLYEAFPPAEARRILDRLEIHHTPKHGSWLNVAEMEISILNRQCLSRQISTIEYLESEVAAWVSARNAKCKRVDWQFTTADARTKLKRLYPSIQT